MRPETNSAPSLNYELFDWGDRIIGTKEQLQSLGLGIAAAFPGEAGANKRQMTTQDPRGYRVEISRDGDRFIALLYFPNLPERPSYIGPAVEVFPGVTRQEFFAYGDLYIGTAQALVSADIVKPGQFPGMPGMFKSCVTIFRDGEVSTQKNGGDFDRRREPGARQVLPHKKGLFRVVVHVAKDVEDERREASHAAEAAWRISVAAMDRPARLLDLDLLSRQRGRVVDFAPPRSVQVVSLAAWRDRRAS